jgi:hypothetical protein
MSNKMVFAREDIRMCTVARRGILCGETAAYWYEWCDPVYDNAPVPVPVFRCGNHRITANQYEEYSI